MQKVLSALFFKNRWWALHFLNSFIFQNVSSLPLYLNCTLTYFLSLRIFTRVFWHGVLLWRSAKSAQSFRHYIDDLFFVLRYLEDLINMSQCRVLLHHFFFLVWNMCCFSLQILFILHSRQILTLSHTWNPLPISFIKFFTSGICPPIKLFLFIFHTTFF